jgi:D-serine deaminase-like pyridoxal phosphate-dependent protein
VEADLPQRLQAAVAALRDRPIAAAEKGFGRIAWASEVSAASLAAGRPPLLDGDFVLPLMVLRESALLGNIDAMAAYCAAAGVLLAPHGKTTMAPQLLARQLSAGAWGITAAMVSQVQVFRSFGIPRILLANEVTDRAAMEWLATELIADPEFECYCFVDSMTGVQLLSQTLSHAEGAWSGPHRPRLNVLVDLGRPGGRAGCRSVDEAVAVAQAAAVAPALRLAGAAGYEGSVGHDDAEATLAAVAAYCRDLRLLGDRLAGLPGCENGYLLSAGGSAYFDLVVRELTAPAAPGAPQPAVLLRSGAYVSHDHGFYQRLTPGGKAGRSGPVLRPAFELWASVLSRPEPDLAIIGAGRHDVAFDQDMPVPLRTRPSRARSGRGGSVAGMTVRALDDQHGYMHIPDNAALAPGDLVCMGISHPCTNFDKWRVIPVVDDEYRVVDAIHTFF